MLHSQSPEPLSHKTIIGRADGPTAVGRRIGISPNTVKAWKRLDSIPAAYWQRISDAGIATLDELAEAAARKSIASAESEAA